MLKGDGGARLRHGYGEVSPKLAGRVQASGGGGPHRR